jgi:PAS domain S-box-containing protein
MTNKKLPNEKTRDEKPPNGSFRLLIIEDRPEDAALLVAELIRAGFSPEWSRMGSADRLVDALYPVPALILCDYGFPGLEPLGVLSTLRELSMNVPVIVISGQMDEETCVRSLRMGAVDYLLKDRLARLGSAVEHALATRLLTIEKDEAERKERETASILRGLVAHAPAAISVKAVDGRYLHSNRQFERLCGLPPGSLIGRIDAEVFPAERAREMTELDARCLHSSLVVEREEEFSDAAGERNLLCVRYPVIDEHDQVFGIGAIYLDITRQKRVEAQLRSARAEVISRAELLGASNEQLRELDRLKTDFIATVSHELRTPLTSIRGYLEMLRSEDVNLAAELTQRFLGIIDRNSEQLLSLIEDLLILSRMDSGTRSALDREVSIPDVVCAAVDTLQPAAGPANVSLTVQIDDDVPAVAGDRDQLQRVVLNLLSNALKFTEEPEESEDSGSISVRVSSRDGAVSLAVTDHGIGIAAEDQHLLFTRFYRAAAARERGIPGTGLGLAVVKGIVDGHGGTVRVNSAPGRGTTVTVHLPVAG